MRILLPPSEPKNPGGRGRSLSRRPATAGSLGVARGAVAAALAEILADDRAAAGALLLPPPVVADALASNRRSATSATLPALDRYAGVVYSGLAASTLTAAERKVADR